MKTITNKELAKKIKLHQKWLRCEEGGERLVLDGSYGTVYVLTNFGSSMEENLYRIYTLRDLGYDPYVMIYDKPHAPREIKQLQRWCNNRKIFKSCPDFRDYRVEETT